MKWRIRRIDKSNFELESDEAFASFLRFDYLDEDSYEWILYLDGKVVGLLSQKHHDVINYGEFADEFEE